MEVVRATEDGKTPGILDPSLTDPGVLIPAGSLYSHVTLSSRRQESASED